MKQLIIVLLMLLLTGCAGTKKEWTYNREAAIRLKIETACLEFQDLRWERQKTYLMQQARGEITWEDYERYMRHIDTIIEMEKTNIYRGYGLEYKPQEGN